MENIIAGITVSISLLPVLSLLKAGKEGKK